MIPTAGLAGIASWLSAEAPTVPTYLGVGTGLTNAALADTALETEVERQVGTVARVGRSMTITYTWGTGDINGNDISELGLLNAAAAGTLFSHEVFPAVSKTVAFQLKAELTMTII